MTSYDLAKNIMLMRDDEVIDVLDELAINWPSSYKQLVDTVKDNAEWHIGEDNANQ